MTVSSATNKSGPYLGNGTTTVFAYDFRILDASHISVIRTEAGVDTVLTTGFTVSGVGSDAGDVTFAVAPTTGQTINLIRNAPFTQQVDLENQGAYYAETVEQAFDLAAMRDQQLQEQINRSLKIPVGQDSGVLDDLIEDVVRLADSVDEIDTVAGIASDVVIVAGVDASVVTVAGIAANVTTVAGISGNVTAVAGNNANVTTVAGGIANVNAVGSNISNVNTVAGNNANVNTVAGISGNVTTVAGIAANVTTVAGISGNVAAVAGISANVTTVAGISADVTAVAANLADVTNFADVYLGPASANPTLRNDGSALQAGDLYFNTVIGQMRVFDGAAWVAASSAVNGTTRRQSFTATAGQTVFAITGGYDAGFADVYLNGVKLVNGVDVTVTSGTDVVLAVGAAAGDSVDVVAYGAFQVADTYSQAEVDGFLAGKFTQRTITGTANQITVSNGDGVSGNPVIAAVVASQADAEAGTDATKLMTPQRVRNALNATGDAPVYACRAWVNFNGTGTVAIRASGNVSSITDNGTGTYRFNFANAMPDLNYCVVGITSGDGVAASFMFEGNSGANRSNATTGYIEMVVTNNTGSAVDRAANNIAIFR